jgi:DNA polymerase III alpha subunit
LALTNHGTPFGLIEHYKVATEKGLKPILGCEMYVTLGNEKPDKANPLTKICHQTILVENAVGYQNLMRLLTLANSDTYFFRKPKLPYQWLYTYKEGLLILSGCPGGLLRLVLENKGKEEFDRLFVEMSTELKGRFWGEVQHKAEFSEYFRAVADASRLNGVPVVATTDAHYVDAADKPAHDFLLGLRSHGTKEKGEEAATYGEGYYLMSRTEMADKLRRVNPWMSETQIARSLDETVEIADRTNFVPVRPERMLPPLWEDAIPRMRALAADGIKRHHLDNKDYDERLARELRVIEMKGYAEYFHICHEVTSWARDNNIMIGPRGSVCGSLLAYVLGITTVDPLVHGTLFERFLHETKRSFPDVDLDIEDRYRTKVLDHVLTKYAPYAIPIITFGRMALGIAKSLEQTYDSMSAIEARGKRLLEQRDYRELHSTLNIIKWSRVPLLSDDEIKKHRIFATIEAKIPGITRVIKRMYGAPYYIGQHPGGVCFVPGDHTAWIAKVRAKDKLQTSYDFRDCEYLGLLKFDFLGIAAMTAVNDCFDLISKRRGVRLTADGIPLNDRAVIEQFAQGRTDGVFQFETPGARDILMRIATVDFSEVAVANALNRPGVSGNLDKYVQGKAAGLSEGVFGDTHGVVVYQEQVMKMLMGLDFTLDECDKFLKTIKAAVRTVEGQQALENPLHKKLAAALVAKGMPEVKARTFTFDTTQYAFNKCTLGDTRLYRGNADPHRERSWITVRELYDAWQSDSEWGKKLRRIGVNVLALCDDGRIRPRRVKGIYYEGKHRVVRVETEKGKVLKVTSNHRLKTNMGYVEVERLRIGDKLVVVGHREPQYFKKGRKARKINALAVWKVGVGGFGNGNQNLGFIDGSDMQFDETKRVVIHRAAGRCEICGKKGSGKKHELEFAHVRPLDDFDSRVEYNEPHNVRRLCNSCHKRFDYAKGERVIRWTRGRPIELERVASLIEVGEQDVYDVEMVGPEHNCVMNGIVSHNSHAVGYALVAYWMMWLREHYPLEFWCALLNSEPFENRRAIYEGCAVRNGVLLYPPHVNGSVGYTVEGNAIRVGLITLDSVGPLTAPRIIKAGPYEKPSDLSKLPRRILNLRTVNVLSSSGALIFPMNSPVYAAHVVRYNVRRRNLNGTIQPKSRMEDD